MESSRLLPVVLKKLENVTSDEPFEVRDLFDLDEWTSYTKGDRVQMGKAFTGAVKRGEVPGVRFIGRFWNNHSRFVKDNTSAEG